MTSFFETQLLHDDEDIAIAGYEGWEPVGYKPDGEGGSGGLLMKRTIGASAAAALLKDLESEIADRLVPKAPVWDPAKPYGYGERVTWAEREWCRSSNNGNQSKTSPSDEPGNEATQTDRYKHWYHQDPPYYAPRR